KNVGSGKSVTVSGISISGADAANYSANLNAATTANISPRKLTVMATGVAKVYDGTAIASAILADDRVSGDVFTDSDASAAFSDKNAGVAKTVTVTGISISGADVGNYVLGNTTASTTADITPRAIEVSAISDSKTYDATTASSKIPSITVGPLAAGDSATFTQVFDSKNAGPRSLIPSIMITDGNNGHNYSVVFHNTNGSISPLAIVGSIKASDKPYDGTTSATIVTRT